MIGLLPITVILGSKFSLEIWPFHNIQVSSSSINMANFLRYKGLVNMKDKILRRIKKIIYQRDKIKAKDAKKLHLGCGNIHIPDFCNVDILKTPAVDVVSDISTLDQFNDDSIELIYACHVLEHFSHTDAINVLTRWFDVLKPGGELRISVPDIDRIVKIYSDNWEHFQTPGHSPWIGLLYGGQGDRYDFHKTGFNFCWLKYIMEKIGYVSISEYSHEPHFVKNITDASLAREPFGQFISLNLLAKKPY